MRRYLLIAFILLGMCFAIGCATATPSASPGAAPRPATEAPDSASSTDSSPTFEAIEVRDETLLAIKSMEVPAADPADLAHRLAGITGEIPATVEPPQQFPQVGSRDTFHAANNDTSEQFEVRAVLQYVTDHAYFWIEEGLSYDAQDLERLALYFENQIYPTTREFFGSEWNPGIDGDPHIYILYITNLGRFVGGYFGAEDEIHPLARNESNAHEMFYFNADAVDLAGGSARGILAHEFQHMIQWNEDNTEDSWMTEGSAELAVHVVGLSTAPRHPIYTQDPSRSLVDWDPDDSLADRGAATLFLVYFLDRFGEELTKDLMRHPANGLEGIDAVLSEAGLFNPGSGDPLTTDDAVRDWAVTNFLNDDAVSGGRFAYRSEFEFSAARQTETIMDCDDVPKERSLNQYGVHYIRLDCRGQQTLQFNGAEETQLLPTTPYSGDYAFWSNKGDESNMRLTRTFDLSEISGSITLSYQAWFDIEDGWDYVHLSASEEGEVWEILSTPSGTDRDPNLNSYGWGYTGKSRLSQWVAESVDLSDFAGKKVHLQFDYITDPIANGEGMLIDDISIPEIGYFSDFEADNGGWEAEGWVRIMNVLPQTFKLAWISLGDETTVDYVPIDSKNDAQIPFDIDEDGPGVLVIVPTTRFTRQPASYSFSFFE